MQRLSDQSVIETEKYSPFWYRVMEILPGFAVWTALLAPFLLSFYFPLQVTVFIIVFDVFWLQKSLVSAYFLYIGWRMMQKNTTINWIAKLEHLQDLSPSERQQRQILDPSEIFHAIMLTTYKEEEAILEASIQSVLEAKYDPEKIIIVLATEERDAENARTIAASLTKKYQSQFKAFLTTEHPGGLAGEVPGKGANANYAARHLTSLIASLHIPFENVIVSTADADTRFAPKYFHCLAYFYASAPNRIHLSYQPIATFLNNIWQTPMISRVMAFGLTFWHLAESVQDYRMFTFSTHAMSLQTLVDMDYWCTSVVNEDSRQFFRAYFHYHGNFKVVPLFIPVYMDAVHVNNFWGTCKNLYLQQQRWTYGIEHFPYLVLESWKHREIPLLNRLLIIWRYFNGAFTGATNAFFISVIGWLPIVLNNSFRSQVLASNFPLVTSWLLSLTWAGVFIANFISLRLLPPPPKGKERRIHLLPMILQWVFVPFSTIFFGALPGIDSQTRLMFGRYLGFRVTEKKAVSPT